MATVKAITTDADFHSHISSLPSTTLAVIYFHAPWAAPCKQMSTILSTLAGTYPADNSISFVSLDAEDLPDISEPYNVESVPYIVLQRASKTLDTISGVDAAKVRSTIEKHAPKSPNTTKQDLPPPQSVTKNLSSYAPAPSDPSTAPSYTANAHTTNDPAPATPTKEELHARLASLVSAAPVMLFMKGTPSAPQCGFSRQTVSLLRERGIRYGFFNILADDDVRQGLKEYAEWPTYPQVWVGGELVGGLDILKEELANDPEFLKDYAVSSTRNAGGPAAPEKQAQPVA